MTTEQKKRTWQSIEKENESLRGILLYMLTQCHKCNGSRKQVSKGGVVFDCTHCGSAWFRYEQATGDSPK